MSNETWAAIAAIANMVLAGLAVVAAWQSRIATKSAAAAATSAAQSVELQLNASQPWLETSGGGRDYHDWEIALQTVEGAHWVHAVELVDMTFVPMNLGSQPKTVSVRMPLTPVELVQLGGTRVSVKGWPVFVDETEWLLFRVDAASHLGKETEHSKWLPTWRLRVEVSPTKEGFSRRRVVLDSRTADPRWQKRDYGTSQVSTRETPTAT